MKKKLESEKNFLILSRFLALLLPGFLLASFLCAQDKSPQKAVVPLNPIYQAIQEGISATQEAYFNSPLLKDRSEQDLWKQGFALLYKFLGVTYKFLPQPMGGEGAGLYEILPYLVETKAQFKVVLEGIDQGLLDDLDGRGRALASRFHLLEDTIGSMVAFASNREWDKYHEGLKTFSVHTRKAVEILQLPSSLSVRELSPVQRWTFWHPLVLVAGVVLLFLSFLFLYFPFQETLKIQWGKLLERAKKLSYEYSRQFVEIKAQYLVTLPFGIAVLIALLTRSWLLGLVLAVAAYYAPSVALKWVIQNRARRCEVQLMDALILLSNALKAGMDIVQGFDLVSRELNPPLAKEVELMLKNYRLGMPFEQALLSLESRVPSHLVSYVVRAIIIQRQTGGNLTKIFDRIVETIREESKLHEKTMALTAQQRIQSVVVAVLPWVMFFLLFLVQAKVMAEFFLSPIGILIILGAIVWETLGVGIIRNMAKIRV